MGRRLKTLESEILPILQNDRGARESDALLYTRILERRFGYAYAHTVTWCDVMMGFSDLPSYDSVSRIRRKLQAKYPELKPGTVVQAFRDEREQEFKEYAK